MNTIIKQPNISSSAAAEGYRPNEDQPEPLGILAVYPVQFTISPRKGNKFATLTETITPPRNWNWKWVTVWVAGHSLVFSRKFINPYNPQDPNNGKRIYTDHSLGHIALKASSQRSGNSVKVTLYALLRDVNGDDEWEGDALVLAQFLG